VAGGIRDFAIGISQRDAAVKYIEGQAEQHKRISFEEEFKKFLRESQSIEAPPP
jgi:hypothetical protein